MEKRLLTPKEIAQATIEAGVGKTKLSVAKMIILATEKIGRAHV